MREVMIRGVIEVGGESNTKRGMDEEKQQRKGLNNNNNKVKVKGSRYRPGVAQRVGRGIALLFHDPGTRRGWVVSSTLRPHFTPGKTRYPFYRRLGEPQGRSGRGKNLVPTGIRSRTVQPGSSVAIPTELPGPLKDDKVVRNGEWNRPKVSTEEGRKATHKNKIRNEGKEWTSG